MTQEEKLFQDQVENFDYASLFNDDIDEDTEVINNEVKKQYIDVKITPSSYDMKHHLARLSMMMAEERGEELSYNEAINL